MTSSSTPRGTVRCHSYGGALTPDGTLVIVGSEVEGRWLGGFDASYGQLRYPG